MGDCNDLHLTPVSDVLGSSIISISTTTGRPNEHPNRPIPPSTQPPALSGRQHANPVWEGVFVRFIDRVSVFGSGSGLILI